MSLLYVSIDCISGGPCSKLGRSITWFGKSTSNQNQLPLQIFTNQKELNTSEHCSASTGVLKKYGIIWEVGPNGGPHIGNPFFPFSRNERPQIEKTLGKPPPPPCWEKF